MDSRFEGVPALLHKWGNRGSRGALDWRVFDDVVASIGERTAFHWHDRGTRALGEGDVGWGNAGDQPAEGGDGHSPLPRVDIEIDEHAELPAGFEVLEHFQHGAFLRDHGVAGTGAKLVEDRTEEFVSEILGDYGAACDRAARDRVGTDESEPFEIGKMQAAVDGGFFGIGATAVALPAFEDDVVADELLVHVRGPEEFEHGAGEGAVGSPSDAAFFGRWQFIWEGGLEILEGGAASAWVAPIDSGADEISKGSEGVEVQLAHEPSRSGEAGVFEPVSERLVHGV